MWALKELTDPARAGYCSCEPPTKVNIEVHIWQALFYACVRVKHGHSSEHINFYLALTHKYPVLLKIVNAYVKIPIAIASLTSFLFPRVEGSLPRFLPRSCLLITTQALNSVAHEQVMSSPGF